MLKKMQNTIISPDNSLMTNVSCEKIKITPKKKQVVFLERQNRHFTIKMNSKLSLGAQCFYLPLCVCVYVDVSLYIHEKLKTFGLTSQLSSR